VRCGLLDVPTCCSYFFCCPPPPRHPLLMLHSCCGATSCPSLRPHLPVTHMLMMLPPPPIPFDPLRLWSHSLFVLRLVSYESDSRMVCEKLVEMFRCGLKSMGMRQVSANRPLTRTTKCEMRFPTLMREVEMLECKPSLSCVCECAFVCVSE